MRSPHLAALLALALGLTIIASGQGAPGPTVTRLLRIPAATLSNPAAVAVDPERNLVYIASDQVPAVGIYDAKANTIARVSLPGSVVRLAVNSVTGHAYLTSGGSNLYVLRPDRTLSSLRVGSLTSGVAVDEARNRVYVSDEVDRNVREIDGRDHKVLATWPVGGTVGAISFDAAHGQLYAAVTGGVIRIDTASGRTEGHSLPNVGSTLTMPLADVVVDKAGTAYALGRAGFNGSNGYLFRLDGSTIPADHNYVATAAPAGLALNPSTNRLYVTDARNKSVNVLDLSAGTFLKQVVIPSQGISEGPIGVALNPRSGTVYATMRYIDGEPYLVVIEDK